MNSIKLIMAIALLLCLLPMPYWYFVMVRFASMVLFAIMAYQYHLARNNVWMVTFGVLALLFQPLLKVSLERGAWSCIDIAVAGLIFYLLWKERPKQA